MPATKRRSPAPPRVVEVPDPPDEEEEIRSGPGAPLVGVGLAILCVLSFLALAVPGGAIGHFLRNLLGYGLGWASYLLPVVIGAFAATALRPRIDPSHLPGRWERPGWLLLFITLAAALQVVGGDPSPTWEEGHGGGLMGQLAWDGLDAAFGPRGAGIVLAILAVLGLAATLRVTAVEVWRALARLPGLIARGVLVCLRGVARLFRWLEDQTRRPMIPEPEPELDEEDFGEDADETPPPRPVPAPPATQLAASAGEGWQLPSIAVLTATSVGELSQTELDRKVKLIEDTLADFDVYAKVVQVSPGPTVTQFGLEPGFRERRDRQGAVLKREKIKVSEIMGLQNDLQLALGAPSLRIEAPVPGRQVVGLEVPNGQTTVVGLRQVIESTGFQKLRAKTKLALALGEDVSGQPVAADLAKMPHLLIAGATGSGKSVCINAIISCLLLQATPDEVRLILIDPKRVEMTAYNDVPHLLRPVVVDVDKVVSVLKWVVREMEERYKLFEVHGVRNIEGFNRLAAGSAGRAAEGGPDLSPLPFIVVIVDELADLMMLAPDDTERLLCRLAQLARATGIHLVVATQRPSVDVITGLIKANFPTRISFAVTSQIDSRTILDATGAEKLLGRGDMLFMPTDAAKPYRLQGVWVSEEEIEALTTHWKTLGPPRYVEQLVQASAGSDDEDEGDELYEKAEQLAREHTRISTSLLQRRLRVGYTRAARLMDLLEANGIVGPPEGGGRSRGVSQEQRVEAD